MVIGEDISFLRLQTAYTLLEFVSQSIQEGGISGNLADAIDNFFSYENAEIAVEDDEADDVWGVADQSSLYSPCISTKEACDIFE